MMHAALPARNGNGKRPVCPRFFPGFSPVFPVFVPGFPPVFPVFHGKRLAKDTSNNGTGTQYYQDDHLGSARIMTDNTGTVISNCTFNAFGEQVSCLPDNASNHYRFTGKERDAESGLDDMDARYYGSALGRFITPDPLGGHPEDPQTLNKYAYVRNNPTTLTDPTGLDFYLRCGDNSSTCQDHRTGATDDKGNFTASVVTSDSIRAGQNSANIDQNGVEVSTGGKTYSGEYFDNPNSIHADANGNKVDTNPIDLTGSGQLHDFSFHIDGNCSGTCLASGSFSFAAMRDATGKTLEERGSFRSIVDRRIPVWGKSIDEKEFHPGTQQYRFGKGPSPHFSLPDNPKSAVPTVGPFHVDKDAPGIKHMGCAWFGKGCN